MRNRTMAVLTTLASVALLGFSATSSYASFGAAAFDGAVVDDAGGAFTQAGGHPYAASTTIELNTATDEFGSVFPDGQVRNAEVELPAGFVGNPSVTERCGSIEDLMTGTLSAGGICPTESQVGIAETTFELGTELITLVRPLYSMEPTAGSPAMFAFKLLVVPILLSASVSTDGDYHLQVDSKNISQSLALSGTKVTFWGTPADPRHDPERVCTGANTYGCPTSARPLPFLTNPTLCTSPGVGLETKLQLTSWDLPSRSDQVSFFSHLPPNYPEAGFPGLHQGPTGCDLVPFDPTISARPTTDQADTPTGLSFDVEVPTEDIENPTGIAQAHVRKVTVALPEGVTLNPSSAEGLSACDPSDLGRETLHSASGSGCPSQSRLGSVDVETPLISEHLTGSVYLAQQDDPATVAKGVENPFDSLLALYIVARSEERGVIVKLAGKVEPDPRSGRIITTFDDLPQLPFSRFHLQFREGGRAPLVMPRACGTYTTEADFVPWSAPNDPLPSEVAHTSSKFQVSHGVGNGPCPPAGSPPFKPDLIAGTLNNAAGTYSPFNLRLTRNDGEGEFTNFSIKLPPGIVGKLAGVAYCPDSAIESSRAKTGALEMGVPSCPKNSEIGSTLVGAGVGSVLTYAPGRVYLAGPYNGSALSIVAITAAKVGPFDLGTVVIREALKIDRRTAGVFIDATGSDPIPHIIDGVAVHARDIRVYVDRPEFILNPTSCDPTSTASTVFGSGLDFASAVDDRPVTVTSPFQAANCQNLPFKPKLKLSVSGSTKRAGNPAFKAVLTMRPGEANIEKAQVTLPGSEFLDNSHIRTVCTRVQYGAEQCPAGSIYGRARAFTAILDQPLEGPVYLRSNPEHELPDLVAKLQNGQIVIDLVGRVDSVGKGRIRNTFEAVPDAPVSKFVLEMAGGKKGLLENSANLCRDKRRAIVAFDGHNGKIRDFRTKVRPIGCPTKKRKR